MDALHIISDQKNTQGGTASSGATQATPLAENSHKKSNLRGGRGRKAGPELTRAVHDVQASEVRLKHDIARLKLDEDRLAEQVGDLETRLKVAREEGLLKSTVKRLEALLTEAHDKLNILKGVIPADSTSRDRILMEEVLKKWKEYEHERTNQARAESKINQSPEDKRAEGDFNRARATAHALKEEIHALVKQGELVAENSTPSPVHDEWVSYTREQAKTEAEALAKKHSQNIDLPPVLPVPSVPLVPPEPVPDVQSAPPDLPVPTHDIHPAVTDGVTTEREPEATNEDYLAKAKAGDEAWETAQKQLKELEEKNHALQQEVSQEPLIVPEEAVAETNTETTAEATPAIIESIEQSEPIAKETTEEPVVKTEVATISTEKPEAIKTEQPLPETPERKAEPYAPTIPKEITPTDQLVLVYAEKQVHEHINNLFGEKGHFGFGAVDGMNSPDWNDPQVGFADKTVAEIMGTKLEVFPSDGKKHFGVEDYAATNKMQEYLDLALKETGVHPLSGEKAIDYLKRASAITIGKFMKKV
ncbi:MAG: hypothetical protein AAB497_03180 [Patescibacteria group bacterium]